MNFLEFIQSQQKIKDINESFKISDIKLAEQIITKYLKKHVSGLISLSGYENTIIDGKHCYSKFYLLPSKNYKDNKYISLNWYKESNTVDVYSIDFFYGNDILWRGREVSILSIYTLGSSIVYFLPVISNVLNSNNFDLSKDDAIKIATYIKESKCDQYSYYVGAQRYKVIENLNIDIIDKLFNETIDRDARDFRVSKRKELSSARAEKRENPSEENKLKVKQLTQEYQEIEKAIRGGATTLTDLKLAIKKNVKVTIEKSKDELDSENEFKEQHEDPEFVLKKMRNYIKMVIAGINSSVILCGAPGIGKTYSVKKLLGANKYHEGQNLITIKGKCTPRQLFFTLYEYKNKGDIILIDDADDIVGPKAPEDVINILKAALDSTSDDNGRLVSYNVSKPMFTSDNEPIPNRFYYNGSIIIITNYNAGSLDTALKGRSFVQDINFTTQDVLTIIKNIIKDIKLPGVTESSKQKAYDFLVLLSKNKNNHMEISIRTFGICAKIFSTAELDNDFSDEEAKSMITEQMKLQAARGIKKY